MGLPNEKGWNFTCVTGRFLSGCNLSNQKLADKMMEKYSDDQNYISLVGEVVV